MNELITYVKSVEQVTIDTTISIPTVSDYPTQVDTQELHSRNEESNYDSSDEDNCEQISQINTLDGNTDEEDVDLVEIDESSFQHSSPHIVNVDAREYSSHAAGNAITKSSAGKHQNN